jgi:hypothetical protein
MLPDDTDMSIRKRLLFVSECDVRLLNGIIIC